VKDTTGEWKIFDYEDFSMNTRVTTMMRTMMQAGLLKDPVWLKPMKEMMVLARGAGLDDMVDALSRVQIPANKILNSDAPEEIKFLAHLFLSQHAFMEADLEAVANHLSEMKRIDPRSPSVYYNESFLYLHKEEFEKSLASLADYEELLGRDSEVCTLYSDVYLAQGKREKAIEVLEEALALNDEDQMALSNYALVIDESKWEHVAEKLKGFSNAQDLYFSVVENAWAEEDHERMNWFTENFKKSFPEASDYIESLEDLKNHKPE
jgi:tetratricopeptide (TPR) repeat protein